MSDEWFEELPDRCPPPDALIPKDFIAYRAVRTIPPTDKDFESYRVIFPRRKFKLDECTVRSISLSIKPECCFELLSLPNREEKYVIEIALNADSGVIKKTGNNILHFSWWRKKNFNVANATQKLVGEI